MIFYDFIILWIKGASKGDDWTSKPEEPMRGQDSQIYQKCYQHVQYVLEHHLFNPTVLARNSFYWLSQINQAAL